MLSIFDLIFSSVVCLTWILILGLLVRSAINQRQLPVHSLSAGLQIAISIVILVFSLGQLALKLGGESQVHAVGAPLLRDLMLLSALIMGLLWLGWYYSLGLRERLQKAEARERHLREKEQTLSHLAAAAYEGIYLVDPEQMCYVDVNPSGAAALQYHVEQMKGMSLEVVHPGETHLLLEQFHKALKIDRDVRFTIEAQRRNGRRILVELSCVRVERDGRQLILTVGRDLSRWQRSTRKIEHLNRLYALLSLSNRAITRIHNRPELFRRICQIAVDEGGFLLAWIGEIKDNRVVPVCFSGHEQGYLSEVKVTYDQQSTGMGPVGTSIREGHVVFVNDVESDSRFAPWRLPATLRGIAAVAAVPIRLREERFGALAIYSSQKNTFDEQFADLLESLGDDLSYAITHMEAEKQRVKAQSQLKKLSRAVEQSADAVMILSTDGLIEYVNPRFTEITGYSAEEVLGLEPGFLTSSDAESRKYAGILEDLKAGRNWKGDFRNRRKNGDLYWSMDTISPIRDENGRITHFVSTSEDYTDLRKAQDMIEQLAFYDPLTELPNRRLLHDRMRQAIQAARREGTIVAVMFLDLDKFKQINDSMGHPAGDLLLREIAKRLRASVRSKDTIARLGGDEFTIVLTDVAQLSDAVLIAEKVLEQIQQPVLLEGQSISITTSIGITLFPSDGDDINDLLRNADLAMYHAKSLGRNNFQFYTEEINQRALSQLDLERHLRQAIEEEQFIVHYQPQLNIRTGEIVGVEALVRWVNAQGATISPDVFVPLAEETGLIEAIGEWVLRQALQDLKQLISELQRPVKVAINLSAYQFRHAERLKKSVRESLRESGIDPSLVELELTESMLVEDVEQTIETLHELRALGISLAIDDFGTGYSSLNYLKQFPIDILKIDRSFVRDSLTNPSDAAITAAIVALGHELNLKVLAEGVETEAQLRFLQQNHCDFYQGYWFSSPVPAERLIRLFRSGVHPLKVVK